MKLKNLLAVLTITISMLSVSACAGRTTASKDAPPVKEESTESAESAELKKLLKKMKKHQRSTLKRKRKCLLRTMSLILLRMDPLLKSNQERIPLRRLSFQKAPGQRSRKMILLLRSLKMIPLS